MGSNRVVFAYLRDKLVPVWDRIGFSMKRRVNRITVMDGRKYVLRAI